MHEGDPMRPAGHKGAPRADMWTEALALHDAGRLRATELRGSDYFGPGTTPRTSYLNDIVIDALLAGRTPFVPIGRSRRARTRGPTCPTWARSPPGSRDRRQDGWGRAWHVPTSPARILRRGRGRRRPTRRRPAATGPRAAPAARHRGGVVVPFMRELRETRHQFERPFVLDSTLTQQTFGLAPTPWEDALEATIAARRPLHRHTAGAAVRRRRARRCGDDERQCDCWRIRLVSSVTWL